MTSLTVLATGPLATVQDLGRRGWAHVGVGSSGAADVPAHRLANRLVGNPPDAATIEITLGGFACRCSAATLVAVTGAPCTISVDRGLPLAVGQAAALGAGTTLRLGTPPTGLRSYLAVRGGVDAIAVLGSRSTDTLSGIGPPPLRAGDLLMVGPEPGTPVPTDLAPPAPPLDVVRVWPGPRLDWFEPTAASTLVTSAWTLGADSDRVGARLAGTVLTRARREELPSEGLVAGAIQVPPDGRPVVMLADHPVTGGYPVIAVVDPDDLWSVAQARPGDVLRFKWRRGLHAAAPQSR